jgi:hypothetical protein
MLLRLWEWWKRVHKEHPVWSRLAAIFVFVVVTLPIWLAQVWTLFSDKPFFQVVAGTKWEWLVIGPLYGWFCFGVGIVLVGFVVAAIITSRTGDDQLGVHVLPYPTVAVYEHLAVRPSPVAERIRRLFADAGWRVEGLVTEVDRHAKGVWIHGGKHHERAGATWGLAILGITPRFDATEDNPPSLQIIVGLMDDQPTPSNRADNGMLTGVPTAPHGKPVAVNRNPFAVKLSLKPHSNGLVFVGKSKSPDILMALQCVITDVRRWSDDHQQYVKLPELYPLENFVDAKLSNKTNLGLDETVDFGAIHKGPESSLYIETYDQGPRKLFIRQSGVWRIDCRIEDSLGRFISAAVWLRWDGKGAVEVTNNPEKATQ